MNNYKIKRIGAYLIDLFIISTLVVLISQLNFVNPNKDKYTKVYNDYVEYYESNLSNVTVDSVEDIINDEYAGYIYDLQYYALGNTIAEILVIILYFTLFPRFNNNQTIGKRLFKLKVIHSENDKKVTIFQHFLRSAILPIVSNVIVYCSITTIFNVLALFIFNKVQYVSVNVIITFVINILCYVDIMSVLIRKDNRALHDLICKTKVDEIC